MWLSSISLLGAVVGRRREQTADWIIPHVCKLPVTTGLPSVQHRLRKSTSGSWLGRGVVSGWLPGQGQRKNVGFEIQLTEFLSQLYHCLINLVTQSKIPPPPQAFISEENWGSPGYSHQVLEQIRWPGNAPHETKSSTGITLHHHTVPRGGCGSSLISICTRCR